MTSSDTPDLPLSRSVPEVSRTVSRMALGAFPTPVEPLRLTGPGEGGELWVKRDDLSGEPYGGNKIRKLEFLLAEARQRGAGRLVTAGALGSHHALATALYGGRAGFAVTLVLCPQRPTDHVRSVLRASHAAGAELRLVRRMELIPVGLLHQRVRHRAARPFMVPPGGSNAHGTLGYVNAALELLEQVEQGRAPMPHVVHVACGTMGTAAGLALGFALGGAPARVSAVRVVGRVVTNERGLGRLISETARLLMPGGEWRTLAAEARRRITIRHDQVGPGYGQPTEAGDRAIERFRETGLTLDPTYTAKAAAGMLADLGSGGGGVHLYWHTLSDRVPEVEGPAEVGELPAFLRDLLG